MAPGDEFGDDYDSPDIGEDGSADLAERWNELGNDQPAAPPDHDGVHNGIDPPTSWPQERKARWSSLSPEDQAFIAAREQEAHSKITTQGQELARLRAEYERAQQAQAGEGQRLESLDQYQTEIERLRTQYQEQVAEIARRDQLEEFNKFAQGKDYCQDEGFQNELINEMHALIAEVPGLKGQLLLQVAHDRVAQRVGIPRQLEQQRQQEQQRVAQQQDQRQREIAAFTAAKIEERDRQWQQVIADREAAWAKHLSELTAKQQQEAEAKTRWAKRAAVVNLKGSPGHSSARPSLANDDATLREIWNRNHDG